MNEIDRKKYRPISRVILQFKIDTTYHARTDTCSQSEETCTVTLLPLPSYDWNTVEKKTKLLFIFTFISVQTHWIYWSNLQQLLNSELISRERINSHGSVDIRRWQRMPGKGRF